MAALHIALRRSASGCLVLSGARCYACAAAGRHSGHRPMAGRCQTVRLPDIGWTDVTATTALTAVLLEPAAATSPRSPCCRYRLLTPRCRTTTSTCSWATGCQRRKSDRKPYVDDGSVEVLGPNLTGAKYTLAVPAYAYEAGLRRLQRHPQVSPDALEHSIYGIEPGNDGNRLILCDDSWQNLFGLGDFKLLESSEQGMLAAGRACRTSASPRSCSWRWDAASDEHALRPAATSRAATRCSGRISAAPPSTPTSRAGYEPTVPQRGRLLRNLHFTVRGREPAHGADSRSASARRRSRLRTWLTANPAVVARWLEGVAHVRWERRRWSAARAKPAGSASELRALGSASHKIPVGDSDRGADRATSRPTARVFFNGISAADSRQASTA